MTSSRARAAEAVHVARQPIFDVHHRVVGYELLYRGDSAAVECLDPGEMATARVLTDSLLLIGLDTLTGGRPAFVNLTRTLLTSDIASVLPPSNAVLEVLETVDVDDEVLAACQRLHGQGYKLALDDYTPGTTADRLLPYAHYVKVDVLQLAPSIWGSLRHHLPAHVRLIAEKVETGDVKQEALAAGFDLFQGYYFCRPTTLSAGVLPTKQLTYARLLATLYKPQVSITEIEEIIKADVSLTYYVLRSLNSAATAMRRDVNSIKEALVLLGLDRVRAWAAIWALTGACGSNNAELIVTALVRARSCELVASDVAGADPSAYFLTGLCSLLDAMLGVPLQTVIEVLPLSDDVRAALSGRPMALRQALEIVMAYERGQWATVDRTAESLSIDQARVPTAYREALGWVRSMHHNAS